MPLLIFDIYAKLHQLSQVKTSVGRFHVWHMKVLLYTVFKDHEVRMALNVESSCSSHTNSVEVHSLKAEQYSPHHQVGADGDPH